MCAAHHCIDERLNEDGCLRTNDVCTENGACLSVDDEAQKTVVFIARLVAECIAFCCR